MKFLDILAKNFSPDEEVFIGENLKFINEKNGNIFSRNFVQNKVAFKNLKDYIGRKVKGEHGDMYICFTPVIGERKKDNAQDTYIIGVDIDGVPIPTDFPPSYYWETSPDKYQGIYVFDNKLSPVEHESLLRKLIIKYNFDPASADIIHFYRIPSTHNYKYKSVFKVSKMQGKGSCYRKSDFMKAFKDVKIVLNKDNVGTGDIEVPEELDFEEVKDKYNLYNYFSDIYNQDRSTWAWCIERAMIKQGATKPEVKIVMMNAPEEIAKFEGDKLDEEVHRAFAKNEVKGMTSFGALKVVNKEPNNYVTVDDIDIVQYGDVKEINEDEAWLIENFWANHSVGLVGAPSKSFKSTFVLNMACAVASGKPFDGNKTKQGSVLIVQGENDLSMEKKKIIEITGETNLPIYFVKSQINLSNVTKLKQIIKQKKIKLLILDPLYLLFGNGDINKHSDITDKLSKLTKLRNDTGVSIILVHHSRKLERGAKITTSDLYGSSFIEGWYESMLLLQRKTKDSSTLTTYFRNFKSGDKYVVKVNDNMQCNVYPINDEDEFEEEKPEADFGVLNVSSV